MHQHNINTRTACISREHGSLIHLTTLAGARETSNDAQHNVWAIATLQVTEPQCLLLDISNLQALSREARDAYLNSDALHNIQALAIVANSTVSHTLATSYAMAYGRNEHPARIFRSVADARAWLAHYIQDVSPVIKDS